ncbi:MAG TPA: PAS domain-containing sensor histidine kinase [Candidatus Saccharimonadales bacterium]|nr:PAS domain-containing sensor histidine kinase [Candidatus Saccharimonadales bacterium]
MAAQTHPKRTDSHHKAPQGHSATKEYEFLSGGGDMGAAVRAHDWSRTSLGVPEQWPQSLRIAVSMVLNSSFPMFIWWGKDELINVYNDPYAVILGEKHKDALGRPASGVWSEIWDVIGPLAEQVFATGRPVYMKDLRLYMNRHGYKEETYFTFSYSAIRDETGAIAGLFCAVTETTEEVIGKRHLEERQAELEAVFQSVIDGIGVFDMQGNLVLLNEALARMNGYPSSEAMKQDIDSFAKIYQLSRPDGSLLPVDSWPISRALRGDAFSSMEVKGKRLDTGQEWDFSFSGSPVIDQNGKQILAITVTRDITESKKAEAELRESEERFRNLADTAPMYLAMADETGRAVYFNRPWLMFTGKKLEEMMGFGWLSVLHPEDAPLFERDFKHAFAEQLPISRQYRFRRADGAYRWMLAVGAPRFTPEGTFIGYYGTYTDVHEIRIAQQAAEDSERRFRMVANNISQLVWTTNPKGRVLWCNQRWYDYTGTTFKDMQSRGLEALYHPAHKDRVTKKFAQKLQAGEVWEDTFPLLAKDGTYRWFLSRAIPIKDDKGTITHWFGTSTDINDLRRATRRKIELERTTTVLERERAELLAINQAKDEFISLASHQLRTPATGVKQYIGMLLQGYVGELNDKQRQFVQTAYESNERQLKVVNDLLKVAGVDSGKINLNLERVDIIPLLQAVLDEQASNFKDSGQGLWYEHPDGPVNVAADSTLLRMALENLVDNAHKYTYPEKNVEVLVTQSKDAVRIAVKDEGTGIAKEDMDKLFTKFSRIDNPLSASVGGSGLGLYWVKRVIDMHGGSIAVESEVGKGTTFTVRLQKDRA